MEILSVLCSIKEFEQNYSEQSLNGLKPCFCFKNKIVLPYQDKIMKIEDFNYALVRVLIQKFAASEGIKIFLQSHPQKNMSTSSIMVTLEQKITPIKEGTIRERIEQDYSDSQKIFDFFEKINMPIQALHLGNIGEKDGKIVIFDFFSNCWVRKNSNIFSLLINGEVLFEISEERLWQI